MRDARDRRRDGVLARLLHAAEVGWCTFKPVLVYRKYKSYSLYSLYLDYEIHLQAAAPSRLEQSVAS